MRMKTTFAALGIGLVMAAGLAFGPSQAQNASDASMTALTSSGDSTYARRLLMWSIGSNNDFVHDILDGALPPDDLELRTRLTTIGTMIYAFANLYRAEPNPYSAEAEAADAGRVSLALPTVWEEFDEFLDLAYEASHKAIEAADAAPEHVLELVEELEVMCDSCHDKFRKPFNFLDFDDIEGSLAN